MLNIKRYQMSKLRSQTQICVDKKAKVNAFILEFEKKKIRVSQLEFEVNMLQNIVKNMQEGGGVGLYPQPILCDTSCKSNVDDGKSTLCANECHVCVQWFPNLFHFLI